MTDQADTPDPIGLAGITTPLNSHEVAVVEAAARTLVALAAEVWALRAEVDQAQSERDAHRSARDWYEQQLRERTTELAAARDREAAVLALHEPVKLAAFMGERVLCVQCRVTSPCPTLAALSQSEPTKERSE